MRLNRNSPAPVFRVHDVYGNEINVAALKGRTIYLAFERNAGCPVCNLRTHELLRHSDKLLASGVIVVMVYESPAERMIEYLGENQYPFHFIADPENELYNLYGVERSILSILRSLFNGIISKVMEGTRLFRKPMSQDGHLDRIPAEFIINPNGQLHLAHYGNFVGDHYPLSSLIQEIKTATLSREEAQLK